MRFSFVSHSPDCGIVLYDAAGTEKRRIPFPERQRRGNVYFAEVDDLLPEETTYLFYRDGKLQPDERGVLFPGMAKYGKERSIKDKRAKIPTGAYDWEDDRCPCTAYSRSLVYGMHVRGFTKHISSGVKCRGTFAGIGEKITYLQEIGVTAIELQPCYEFEERPVREEIKSVVNYPDVSTAGQDLRQETRINYWGYVRGYYYAPKAAYAATKDPVSELKDLIKALHKRKMELIMQFYFPAEINRNEIGRILRFWAKEYHVDGFRLLGVGLPVEMIAADELLADKKIWYEQLCTENICRPEEVPAYPHMGVYNDGYLYDMRRFLKGDGNLLSTALMNMRYLPGQSGRIHYLTNYCGMTLADMVSYDGKHNEANGENNRDGNDYNCSWNCGEEGTTRSRRIKALRLRQMKNAMCLLMLTQSTPYIFMGDEFGNTQKGNNNPWCQDNLVTWIDWKYAERNRGLAEFWKMLAEFRKSHPILHPERELKLMDTISCGYPDLSYHGENAWSPKLEDYRRYVGIMLCESYAKEREEEQKKDIGGNGFIYIALNMHWEDHVLALPRLPKGYVWSLAFSTAAEAEETAEKSEENMIEVAQRSVAVYVSKREVPLRQEKTKRKASAVKTNE